MAAVLSLSLTPCCKRCTDPPSFWKRKRFTWLAGALCKEARHHRSKDAAITPPQWVDEYGKLLATRPCHRCGTPVPVGRTFRLEHIKMIGWQLFAEAQIVQWCGHDHHFLVVRHAGGERAVLDLRGVGVMPPRIPPIRNPLLRVYAAGLVLTVVAIALIVACLQG